MDTWMKTTDPSGIFRGRMVKAKSGVVSAGVPLTAAD
jgi:hypothetical protein